ncbi:MAG TPA: segregation/condensation protein A [Candidatus Binatia bacterium]|nr:segregation/condensation protein A [Candidatus Binatia bacterium]
MSAVPASSGNGAGPAAAALMPSVVITEARTPETATRVTIADFDGPLGLLLALIEGRRLDVLTVPLGALAGAYLEALATLEADRIGNVSSFIAVASQLILIKSRALLPRREASGADGGVADDETDPEAELRARLLLYRAFRDAGATFQANAHERGALFRREASTATASALAGSRPPDGPPLDAALLSAAIDALVRIAPPPPVPPEILRRTITIAERAAIIRAALQDADSVVLQDLLAGVRDRIVAVVTFLAMLELMKRREIVVEQAAPWGPIVARRPASARGAEDGR